MLHNRYSKLLPLTLMNSKIGPFLTLGQPAIFLSLNLQSTAYNQHRILCVSNYQMDLMLLQHTHVRLTYLNYQPKHAKDILFLALPPTPSINS